MQKNNESASVLSFSQRAKHVASNLNAQLRGPQMDVFQCLVSGVKVIRSD